MFDGDDWCWRRRLRHSPDKNAMCHCAGIVDGSWPDHSPSGNQKKIFARLQLFEISRLLVRVDYIASFIVNANHSMM
jgi:hypothetical protein